MRAIGVDIGGTKLAIGSVGHSGQLRDFELTPLPTKHYDRLIAHITARIAELTDGSANRPAVGIAMAAWLSPDRGDVVSAVSLGWERRQLRQDLARSTGLHTVLHNDANAAAWGEYVLAGAPSEGAFVMLTLGTDVGGGVICDGRLITGASGLAGELGHLQVDSTGPACVCGRRGCLAVYASGKAILAGAVERGRAAGLDTSAWTGPDVAARANAGDTAVLTVIDDAARAIALACGQLACVIDPHTVVLGGGASAIGDVLLDAVRKAVARIEPMGPVHPRPHISLARAGNRAGVLGAAELAVQPQPGL
ncbi:ROK family protein [Actinoplanes sp. NPDC051470]|uniref:ROK family protein n=1 Tax=Actinoplanes sp. NPDC051470 TaxID=3157224 RepID=UPI00341B2057